MQSQIGTETAVASDDPAADTVIGLHANTAARLTDKVIHFFKIKTSSLRYVAYYKKLSVEIQ